MLDKLRLFWGQQAEWSNITFGSDAIRGPVGPLKHLEKEVKEALEEAGKDSPDPAKLNMEIVDCLFLTLDSARRAGMSYDILCNLAFEKLAINKARKWIKVGENEAVEHDRSLNKKS